MIQPSILDESHECDCTDRPAVVVNGTGIEFNLNSFAIVCTAGSQPAIVVDGKSNSILGRQREQSLGDGNGTRSGINGCQFTQIRIQLQGFGNHTIQDLAVGLSDDSIVDQVGVQIESSGNTLESCDIDIPSSSDLSSDLPVGVRVIGNGNVLSNNDISAVQTSESYGIYSFGDDCLIIGNTISRGYYGIFLEWGSCKVLENYISAQQYAAIEVNG